MKKQFVTWLSVWTENVAGEPFLNPYILGIIAHFYRGTLLSQILAMKPQRPISLSDAVNLIHVCHYEAINAGRIGPLPGQCYWYCENFVQWISMQGFHIEITGDEFESSIPVAAQ